MYVFLFLFSFFEEWGIVECKVSLAILGTEIEREGERMMLIVHLFTYTYTYKSLLWEFFFWGELNEIC